MMTQGQETALVILGIITLLLMIFTSLMRRR